MGRGGTAWRSVPVMSERLQFDRRMSDAEAAMWRLEKDPYLSSTFANVTILDRPVDVDRFVRRMEHAAHHVPRLRQRVQPVPGGLSAPSWVEDPAFDIRYHVRHVALPKPGSLRQLCDLATIAAADPFDRTRPLWQFIVVDGLRGGKGALVQKLHHTVADGEGSLRLSLQFLDIERDAPEPAPLPAVEPDDEPAPDPTAAVREIVAGGLRLPLALVRQLRDLLAEPARIPEAGAAAIDTLRGVVTQLSDVDRAHSPLWTSRSLRRRLETLRVPLDATKATANALGGTVNTAFITAAAAAAGAYHRELGEPVDHLRASMAISTRRDGSGANAFSLARLLVPTGKMTIAERFTAIAESVTRARGDSAGASIETLSAIASALPTSVVTRIARQQAETLDFATSNVRAASFPCYIAGAQVLENYPVGPLGGVAFNLTAMSYCGSFDMGLHIDPAAVTQPDLLRRCAEEAFAELAAAAG
jgi:diacylglycerol O-acyltransferase / wax synthase